MRGLRFHSLHGGRARSAGRHNADVPRDVLRRRHEAGHRSVEAKDLSMDLPASAQEIATGRGGSTGQFTFRHTRLRGRAAHRDGKLEGSRPADWLLVEWPEDEEQPTKRRFGTPPEDKSFAGLVDATKLRRRIEWDCQDLDQEVGLGHDEGRGWRGFHHHATSCIAAYVSPTSDRGAFPHQESLQPGSSRFPRGRPDPATARSVPSGTWRTPSPPCAGNSPSPCRDAESLCMPACSTPKGHTRPALVTQ